MTAEETNQRRHHAVADYQIFSVAPSGEVRERLLLALYAEVVGSWKDLHEVRFRLLGLLPLVTIGTLTFASGEGSRLALWSLAVFALGLCVSFGLFIYDKRNSELYDDLISRGRKIEAELAILNGVFRGRLDPKGWIRHDVATNLIYASVMVGWVCGLLLSVGKLIFGS